MKRSVHYTQAVLNTHKFMWMPVYPHIHALSLSLAHTHTHTHTVNRWLCTLVDRVLNKCTCTPDLSTIYSHSEQLSCQNKTYKRLYLTLRKPNRVELKKSPTIIPHKHTLQPTSQSIHSQNVSPKSILWTYRNDPIVWDHILSTESLTFHTAAVSFISRIHDRRTSCLSHWFIYTRRHTYSLTVLLLVSHFHRDFS